MFSGVTFVRSCILAVVCGLLLTSCKSKFEKVVASNDSDYKYRQATYYYNLAKEKPRYYENARVLLEDLRTSYAGTKKIEEIYYYLAYCYFGLGDLEQARFYFKTFADTYPNSQYTEDSRFQVAYCYYKNSPVYSLDQTDTYKAVEAFQLFINLYPNSDRVEECNQYIDELRAKLERKSYEKARVYYTTANYPAALLALKNSLQQFPDTDYREDIEFLILKSHFLYAENSIQKRRQERYNETILAYKSFTEQFPESKYQKEADNINKQSQVALEKLEGSSASVTASK